MTYEEMVVLDDAHLIEYCSMNADGSPLIHILCDRLTQSEMKLKNVSTAIKKIEETLLCVTH